MSPDRAGRPWRDRGFVRQSGRGSLVVALALSATVLTTVSPDAGASEEDAPDIGRPAAAFPPAVVGVDIFDDDRFRRRTYVGFGLGRSWLEPDTDEIPGVDPDDRVNLGGQLTIGTDLKKWVSLEGHIASLGEAGLSGGGGGVDYTQLGASALFYAGKSRHRFNRRGFSGYGRIGLGFLQTEGSGDIEVVADNAVHLLAGVGLEYATRRGLGLRAEGIAFDADANYLQLGAIYRFGKRRERRREVLVSREVPVVAAAEPIAVPAPVAAPAAAMPRPDGDRDGVDDLSDECPTTAASVAVDERGCALLSGVIEGLNFASNSAELTAEAIAILSDVIETLRQFPSQRFEVAAHTDSNGPESANLALSRRRAAAVAEWFIASGIGADRFDTRAYGETRPVTGNDTAAGRFENRRVELTAIR